MTERENNEAPKTEYTKRSEIESICMSCFATVRSKFPKQLEMAENAHSQLCPARSGQPSTQF